MEHTQNTNNNNKIDVDRAKEKEKDVIHSQRVWGGYIDLLSAN